MRIDATSAEILALFSGLGPVQAAAPAPQPAIDVEEMQNRLRFAMMHGDPDTPSWMQGHPVELD